MISDTLWQELKAKERNEIILKINCMAKQKGMSTACLALSKYIGLI